MVNGVEKNWLFMFEGFLNWMDGCQLDEQGFKLQSRLYFVMIF